MYMNYKKNKKYILVFSPFLSLEPKRKEEKEERNLGRKISTSFLARRISIRKGVAREVRNPVHNSGDRGR